LRVDRQFLVLVEQPGGWPQVVVFPVIPFK
jgi:hypothetical protein